MQAHLVTNTILHILHVIFNIYLYIYYLLKYNKLKQSWGNFLFIMLKIKKKRLFKNTYLLKLLFNICIISEEMG